MLEAIAIVAANLLAVYFLAGAALLLCGVAPPVSSSRRAVGEAAKIIGKRRRFAFVDLGSGTGRVALGIAKRFPEARAVGIEKNPMAYLLANSKRLILGRKNARFIFGDITRADLRRLRPDYVYTYLGTGMGAALGAKFRRELKKGALVIANKFEIPGLGKARIAGRKYFLNGPTRIYKI